MWAGSRWAGFTALGYVWPSMHHHPKFEHSRFIGDKRTQLVYDLDGWDDEATIDEIVKQGVGLSFGPDTLAEARNRGYKPYKGDGSGTGSGDAPTEG